MTAIRISEFDIWRAGYANSSVSVKIAGTNTLASLFTDEALTLAAANPQTLLSQEDGDILYGKFSVPLYTASAYYLDIDGTDDTGVVRPAITTLDGEDASLATARRTSGSIDVTLASVLARTANPIDFGEFLPTSNVDASAATNTTSIEDAVSAVSAGGIVTLPAGTYAMEDITLPAGVVVQGQGRGVTILQSATASNVWTINGDKAGFRDLSLDGVSLIVGSVGVHAKNKAQTVMERVTIKRFALGLFFQGGQGNRWRDLDIEGCTVNAQIYGDTASASGGAALLDNSWEGACRTSVTTGIDLSYVDAIISHFRLCIAFEDNAATALKVRGARYVDLSGSWWEGNATNLNLADFVTGSFQHDNTILGFWVRDFRMSGGAMTLTGKCGDVVFERGSMSGVAVTLTLPTAPISVRDVVEDSAVTISGSGEKWTRWAATDHGASSGLTTNATATEAWSISLEPGQRCYLEAKVIGNSRTSDASGEYHIAVSARRPPSTLPYDIQTANFTVGTIITGATSGATARVVADADGGATGTLSLRDIVGTFVDDEIITDTVTGSASVNGSITNFNAALLGAVTALRAAREDVGGWDATFAANGPTIELQVTGAVSTTIEWLCHVDVVQT